MGYFVAYRHTGADPERLEELLPVVRDTLQKIGEVYCTYFDEADFQDKQLSARNIMDHAFAKIEALGGLFVLLDGPDKSEGMLMEIGYCIAKAIPIVVAKRAGVDNTYVDQMTDKSFNYSNADDLITGIKENCKG